MTPTTRKLVTLMGSASLLTLANALSAQAQMAPASAEVPEQVLVTGSLIHGAASVGVPVTQVSPQDFTDTAAVNVSDYLKYIPAISVPNSVNAAASPGGVERGTYVSIHGEGGAREELLVNGMRFPLQTSSASAVDPSVVPELAVDHVDILADGASATYGSDAIAGVINVIMKRGFEGAETQFRFGTVASSRGGGNTDYQASQLYGKKWDSGDITLSYLFDSIGDLDRTADRLKYQWTHDYTPWGLDDRSPLASSFPGVVSTGKPSSATGTSCTNCYSVPKGQPVTGLTWAQLLAHNGVTNEVSEFASASLGGPQQTNSFTATFDQNIYPGVQFFGDVFYTNRQARFIDPIGQTPVKGNAAVWSVPTTNPFYPIGAPSGLRVDYSFAAEIPTPLTSGEIAKRYDGGFNLDLPYNWTGRIFASASSDYSFEHALGAVNPNSASAALGNTISAAESGTTPAVTFTKPANIPYLNLFCDPTAFQCNDPATLAYISGYRLITVTYLLQEYGATFDGPVWTLPAGDLKAAVGVNLTEYDYFDEERSNYATIDTSILSDQITPFKQEVPAAFVQFNIPVFGDNFSFPLLKKLNFELSGRYDHYYTFGTTTNPKAAFDWTPFDGVTVSGAWGTEFRAPGPSDTSATDTMVLPINLAAGGQSDGEPLCTTVGGKPKPGSAAALLNPTCSAALQYQGGISVAGGSDGAGILRGPTGDGLPTSLQPEKAVTTSITLDLTPTFLPGLELRGTYWNRNITNVITGGPSVGGTGPALLNDPIYNYVLILPSNPNFAKDVQAILALPFNQVPRSNAANISWIADSASENGGFVKRSGVDFMANYTYPIADGAIQAGVNGSYVLRILSQGIAGSPVVNGFNLEACNCNTTTPVLKARFNLGWTDGTYTVVGFVNYNSHSYANQSLPPASYLTTFPNYSDVIPAFTTVDLSLGYTTGEMPARDYLKNLTFNLVVLDVMDKVAPFTYMVNTQANNPSAFNSATGNTPFGRQINFILTKKF
jgi:iron complex outermembrane recepter protein